MPNGGFLVKFMGEEKEIEHCRCYKVCLNYDTWTYSINDQKEKIIPDGIVKIEVVPE